MDETEDNHWPAASHWQTRLIMYWVHLAAMSRIQTHHVSDTDYTDSCKSNNHDHNGPIKSVLRGHLSDKEREVFF